MSVYKITVCTSMFDRFGATADERAELLRTTIEQGVFDPRDQRIKRFEVREVMRLVR